MRGISDSAVGRRRHPPDELDDGLVVLGEPELEFALEPIDEEPAITAELSRAQADHLSAWTGDRKLVCLHEAAHAVGAVLLGLPVSRVDTKSVRGGLTTLALGEESQSRYVRASAERARIVMLLCGPEMERLVLGEATSGSSRDHADASWAAAQYYEEGLSTDSPYFALSVLNRPAPSLLEARHTLVVELMERCRHEAKALVAENRERIVAFARCLLAKEALEGDALAEAFARADVENPKRVETEPEA